MSQAAPARERVFSGIQPSGASHLGNYLGAQANYVALQDQFEAIYAIVDYHALTTVHDGAELRLRPEGREAFAEELAAMVAELASRHHDEAGEPHRLLAAAHPIPQEDDR